MSEAARYLRVRSAWLVLATLLVAGCAGPAPAPGDVPPASLDVRDVPVVEVSGEIRADATPPDSDTIVRRRVGYEIDATNRTLTYLEAEVRVPAETKVMVLSGGTLTWADGNATLISDITAYQGRVAPAALYAPPFRWAVEFQLLGDAVELEGEILAPGASRTFLVEETVQGVTYRGNATVLNSGKWTLLRLAGCSGFEACREDAARETSASRRRDPRRRQEPRRRGFTCHGCAPTSDSRMTERAGSSASSSVRCSSKISSTVRRSSPFRPESTVETDPSPAT